MSSHEQVLEVYGSLSERTGHMLEAAKSSDWDRLIALEQDCRGLIERLKDIDVGALSPDPQYVQRKTEMIRKVLADDAEIRKHTEPWMERLQALLGNARQMNRLERTYGSGAG